ncbi:MAG: MBL fold metallo-hydrolase [Anaerolineae bacterium]|jgi:hydroxyacylglutathione hydrolase
MNQVMFEQIRSRGLAHFSYLLGRNGVAAVIDPRRDCEVYVDLVQRRGYQLRYIIETHRNEDYAIGSLELARLTGAEIWHAEPQLPYRYGLPVEDGQTFDIGGLVLRAFHAPGHTEGMMNYVLHDPSGVPWMVFTGDTLLAGDVGRTDLLGKDRLREAANLLYDTIFGKILPLGDHVIVCPAHGAGSVCGSERAADRPLTTIGIERVHNPALQHTDRESFVQFVAHELERPPYFTVMERLNLEGPPVLGRLPGLTPLSVDSFDAQAAGAQVLDTRLELAFNAAHVPGALSIWEQGIPSFAGWFVNYDQPILLVSDTILPERAVRYLIRMGFDRINGYLGGGMVDWHTSGRDSDSIGMVTVQELCGLLDSDEQVWILDVRSQYELDTDGRIPGAHHIHITQLPQRVDEVPRDVPVFIFCGSGLRSTVAASLLQAQGYEDLTVVLGGAAGWNSTTCPLDLREAAL